MTLTKALAFCVVFLTAGASEAAHRYLSAFEVVQLLKRIPVAGYTIGRNAYLEPVRQQNGRPFIPGYASFSVYVGAHPLRYYSVRLKTGDVVDPMACSVYRSPMLSAFKRKTMKAFSTNAVSLGDIANEIGCDPLRSIAG